MSLAASFDTDPHQPPPPAGPAPAVSGAGVEARRKQMTPEQHEAKKAGDRARYAARQGKATTETMKGRGTDTPAPAPVTPPSADHIKLMSLVAMAAQTGVAAYLDAPALRIDEREARQLGEGLAYVMAAYRLRPEDNPRTLAWAKFAAAVSEVETPRVKHLFVDRQERRDAARERSQSGGQHDATGPYAATSGAPFEFAVPYEAGE